MSHSGSKAASALRRGRGSFASDTGNGGRRAGYALGLYRADYDDKLAALRPRPVHDWCSHSADAFRYLAMSLDRRGASGFNRRIAYPAQGVA
jgi:hypothetical protein